MNTPATPPLPPKRGPGRPPGPGGAPKARPPSQRTVRDVGKTASPEARKLAAAILEVLGGVRTTTDAAAALGCSLPRYYQLEARALEGLLGACEPVRRGPGLSPTREAEALRKKCARLEREVGRQQALVRAAHRAVGLAAVPAPTKPKPGKKHKRRPTARALVAARVIKAVPAPPVPVDPAAPSSAS